MSEDPTLSQIRKALVPKMPAELEAVRANGGQVWDTEQMKSEFTVMSFMAPFVIVRRKSDDQTGTLKFTHQPRWYFDWLPDNIPPQKVITRTITEWWREHPPLQQGD